MRPWPSPTPHTSSTSWPPNPSSTSSAIVCTPVERHNCASCCVNCEFRPYVGHAIHRVRRDTAPPVCPSDPGHGRLRPRPLQACSHTSSHVGEATSSQPNRTPQHRRSTTSSLRDSGVRVRPLSGHSLRSCPVNYQPMPPALICGTARSRGTTIVPRNRGAAGSWLTGYDRREYPVVDHLATRVAELRC